MPSCHTVTQRPSPEPISLWRGKPFSMYGTGELGRRGEVNL